MISYPAHPSSSSSSCSSFPMDSTSDFPTNRPSPRQLQGPRPTPLKVRKDSYKINKKPPAVPQNTNHPPQNSQQAPPPPPPRPPLIIYTVSPKIIHTNPNDFMTLVQRLTGPDSVSSPSAAGSHSPAARFAAIENADKFSPRSNSIVRQVHVDEDEEVSDALMDHRNSSTATTMPPGILSPLPSSLPPISSSFFSPISSFDPGSFGYLLQDLSPGPTGGFLVSPHNLLNTPTVPSPGAAWDLFNQF